MPQISRRFFIGSLIAAPAIVRFPSLMKLPKYTIEDFASQAWSYQWKDCTWEFDSRLRLWHRIYRIMGVNEYGHSITEDISV